MLSDILEDVLRQPFAIQVVIKPRTNLVKKLFSLLLVIATLNLATTYADCCSKCWFSSDQLLLKPSVDDTYFVISAPATGAIPTGTRIGNDSGLRWGVRAGTGHDCACCNRGFSLYYTHLRDEDVKSVDGSFLWATAGGADLLAQFENYTGTATSKINYLYHQTQMEMTQGLHCRCVELTLRMGLEAAYIRLHEDYRYSITAGSTGEVHYHSSGWGLGPMVGTAMDYCICERKGACPTRWSLVARTSASLLSSHTGTHTFQTVNGTPVVDVKDRKTWRLIPAWHGTFGLRYHTASSCCESSFELGCEVDSYSRAITRANFADDVADGMALNSYTNFDLQGIYLRSAIGF